MSEVTESSKSSSSDNEGFINYILTFKDDQKNEVMNIMQYCVLAIIPVMVILKSVKTIVPADDESKGCLEITIECVLQIVFIMVAIWLTDRIIRYVPTYSKEKYGKFIPENFIIPLLIILATMQSKLGFKLNILMDRCLEMWNGKPDKREESGRGGAQNKGGPNYRLPSKEGYANPNRQAGFGELGASGNANGNANSQAMMNTSLTGSVPAGAMPQMGGGAPSQQNFNDFYAGSQNNMQNQPFPSPTEPSAANESLGGSFGSSW